MIGNPTPQTALATNGDAAVAACTRRCSAGYVVNKGSADGFFRVDSGDWIILPAGGSVRIGRPFSLVEVCRIPSGTDLASIWFIGEQ